MHSLKRQASKMHSKDSCAKPELSLVEKNGSRSELSPCSISQSKVQQSTPVLTSNNRDQQTLSSEPNAFELKQTSALPKASRWAKFIRHPRFMPYFRWFALVMVVNALVLYQGVLSLPTLLPTKVISSISYLVLANFAAAVFIRQHYVVNADIALMQRVFANLIHNAINFTQEYGRISIDFAVNKGRIKVSVKDTGQGIDPKDLSHIFDRHYYAQKITEAPQKTTSSGLGLAIVKKILELHDSTIKVSNRSNQGSQFQFLLQTTSGTLAIVPPTLGR